MCRGQQISANACKTDIQYTSPCGLGALHLPVQRPVKLPKLNYTENMNLGYMYKPKHTVTC